MAELYKTTYVHAHSIAPPPIAISSTCTRLCEFFLFQTHTTHTIVHHDDCVIPEPNLNVATFTDENGTLSANFSWKLSETSESQTVCRLVFSDSFNSTVPYDFEDHQEPVAASDIRFIPSQNVNFFVFEGIDRRRYHQFQLRIQSSLGTASAETNKYTSFVYYFGQQGTLIPLSISLSLFLTLTPSFSLSCSDC